MAKKKKARRAAGKSADTTRSGARRDPDRIAIDAAMRLAADKGWHSVTLAAIAGECGVPLAEIYRRFPSRAAILAGLSREADRQVLQGGTAADEGESARDRLFDVMMRRFDALKPWRQGIARVVEDLPRDPLTMACFGFQLRRSMAWMLEAAGISSGGPAGLVKTKGLAAIHLFVLRTWLNDDSPDMAKTMAALDAALKRIAPVAEFLFRARHSLG